MRQREGSSPRIGHGSSWGERATRRATSVQPPAAGQCKFFGGGGDSSPAAPAAVAATASAAHAAAPGG